MLELLKEAFFGGGTLEMIAVWAAIIYIILSIRQNIWCWLFGIISCTAWMITVMGQLHMQTFLQLFYIVMGFYGWWQWYSGAGEKKELPVTRLTFKRGLVLLMISLLVFLVLGLVNRFKLEGDYPWWDALTTGFSITATYMLAKKIIENWIVFFIADAILVIIYNLQGWKGLSAMMIIYMAMAIIGWGSWYKSMKTSVES
jgi:nicotinamide mononucleotide transporter